VFSSLIPEPVLSERALSLRNGGFYLTAIRWFVAGCRCVLGFSVPLDFRLVIFSSLMPGESLDEPQ
jgi:hypothetical protein